MADKEYNGWTNYETWNVALWLGNEQGSERYWASEAEDRFREAESSRSFTREDRAALDLAEQLKNEIEETAPELGASMFSDLLSAALSEVNWLEIARHYIDDNMGAVIDEETESATVEEDA